MNTEQGKMMIRWKTQPTAALLVTFMLVTFTGGAFACGGSEPPAGELPDETGVNTSRDGTTTLVAVEAIEPGAECQAGGVRVLTGLDEDRDGKLSAEEASDGTETVQCDASSESACGGAVAIERVDASPVTFTVGAATVLKVTATPEDEMSDARILLLGGDFDIVPGPGTGEFSVTPRLRGGPFTLTAVVANRCSVDNADFVVDEVLPMTGP